MDGTPPRPRRPRGRSRGRLRLVLAPVAALLGVVMSGTMVVQGTEAAFTGRTGNPGSGWTAGAVTISDDDNGTALFTATGLLPGATGSTCIRVTYSGGVAASVRLHASVTGSLAPHVDLVVEQGDGVGNTGGFGSCTGFSGLQVYSGTLSAFPTTFAGGSGTFAPTASGQFAVYRFTYTLNAATPSAQQGTTASATFQWESRS